MKQYTINDLVEADWFPFSSRITIRKYIDSGELKAKVVKVGGILQKYQITSADAQDFADNIKAKYKRQYNIN
jgi:hypothetical protein